jgi:N-acetyl sugar amidotransferase
MNLIWCKNCLLPNSKPNILFNKQGICYPCVNYQKRKKINWKRRSYLFEELVKKIKKKNKNYDCLIPVSGGKDSTWQTSMALKHGLKCLAFTWKPIARTSIGEKNLKNLISLGVDHIDWTINPKLEKKMMLISLKKFGSTAIPMHIAIHNISRYLSVKLDIPLILWGENSDQEYGSGKLNIFNLSSIWRKKYSVTQNASINDFVCSNIKKNELLSFFPKCKKSNNKEVFLGSFFAWDPKRTSDYSKKLGFKEETKPRIGTYKFADIDDDFISIHHWIKWYKFGFTREFDNLSIEIRSGRISREKAISTIKKNRNLPPISDIRKFCLTTGISIKSFFNIIDNFRNKKIWFYDREVNKWKIKNFIIKNYNW